jgi:acetyl-CoA acyltransferase
MSNNGNNRRAVIVRGARTPFIRSFGDLNREDAISLGTAAVKGLLERSEISWKEIDSMVWGGVVIPPYSVNVGREIVLELGLPPEIEASTVTRACTSSLYAITQGCAAIERGEADVVIAGGGDSTSNASITLPPSLMQKAAPVMMNRKSGPADYLRLASQIDVRRDVLPRKPAARERSTGELMGESAEKMADLNQISREAQDELSAQSHRRAARAIASGRFSDEIVPVITSKGKKILADNIVRGDATVEKLGKLKPAFKKGGTLTAGNSSPLTDGAACCLLMEEQKARSLGYEPLAAFRSWSYDAVDPSDQLLIGPAISMPRCLIRASMSLSDIDLVDIHEAFAAQVLSVLKMMASDVFARERLGLDKAPGVIDPTSINVHGGSISLGHPFAATGARMVTTMANELKLTGKSTALIGICGQGGVSAGAILESI